MSIIQVNIDWCFSIYGREAKFLSGLECSSFKLRGLNAATVPRSNQISNCQLSSCRDTSDGGILDSLNTDIRERMLRINSCNNKIFENKSRFDFVLIEIANALIYC